MSQGTIKRQVVVEGNQVAFEAGETVEIISVQANPQNPAFKYGVLSQRLQKRFQLSDDDIQPIQTVQQAVPPAEYSSYAVQQIPQNKSSSHRRTAAIIIVILAAVVLTGAALAVFLLTKGNNYKQYKTNAQAVMTVLEKIDDGLEIGYTPKDYSDLVTQLNIAVKKFERQCSEEENKYPSYTAIQSAATNYILAEEKWKEAIKNTDYSAEPDMTSVQETWSIATDCVSATRDYLNNGDKEETAKITEKNSEKRAGVLLVFRAMPSGGTTINPGVLQKTVEKIRDRLNRLGVSEPEITTQGDRDIQVRLPGLKYVEQAKTLVTAQLQFRIVNEQKLESDIKKDPKLKDDPSWKATPESELKVNTPITLPLKEDNEVEMLKLSETKMTGDAIKSARVEVDNTGSSKITFKLTGAGTKTFADLTTANVNKRLAILLDYKVESAPTIQQAITDGSGEITGKFTDAEAKNVSIVLNTGALPIDLKLIYEK